ncbi:MAG: hypothetical protein B6I28_03025 [Fusobacteriia bacterium 4572_132]|nr:MAG: hypothetical protein B6I28_03025 [Fusobacteriia bacterium 4572_132]
MKNLQNKIITVFYELVAEKGYDKASMNDIVKKAGISKGAIYHHFKNKEELFCKVIEVVFLQNDSEEIFDLNQITKENARDVLYGFVEMIFKSSKKDKFITKFQNEFIVQALRNEKLKGNFLKIMDKYLEQIKGLLVYFKENNIIDSKKNIEVLGQKFFMLLDAMLLYKAYGIDFKYEEIIGSMIDEILGKENK